MHLKGVPEGDELAEAHAVLEKELAEEVGFWQAANLPPAGMIYQLGPQQFEHHCHGETFLRLFKLLGITDDQLNFVYKQVVLKELRGLRKVAKEARKEAIRNQIVDGVGVLKPKLDI